MVNEKPGDSLEEYLIWKYNLHVILPNGAPCLLGIAIGPEAIVPLTSISWKNFQFMIDALSECKKYLEETLNDYDPDLGSWAEYDQYVMQKYFDDKTSKLFMRYIHQSH